VSRRRAVFDGRRAAPHSDAFLRPAGWSTGGSSTRHVPPGRRCRRQRSISL